MRIIQRCIFYSFLREITTKPHHWPCHLERSRDDKKKIVLLSCTDGATEGAFGATKT